MDHWLCSGGSPAAGRTGGPRRTPRRARSTSPSLPGSTIAGAPARSSTGGTPVIEASTLRPRRQRDRRDRHLRWVGLHRPRAAGASPRRPLAPHPPSAAQGSAPVRSRLAVRWWTLPPASTDDREDQKSFGGLRRLSQTGRVNRRLPRRFLRQEEPELGDPDSQTCLRIRRGRFTSG